jgi:pimeloyl-ACP methyl ester carboxylesterase
MLASERHGRGEPLVLVHGVTHRRQAWYPVLDRLVEHREVILVDLPGHGESDPLELRGRGVAQALRDEFTQFLAEQGLGARNRPHVAGYSLGGRVALEAGSNGDARSVTAFSPAGFWRTSAEFAYTRHLFTSAATLVDKLGPRAESLARTRAGRSVLYGVLVAHPSRISRDQALGDVRAFAYAIPALCAILDAATPFDDPIPAEVPVTVAWAARDLVLPPWQAEVAREKLPHAEHVRMRGVGHVPMWDAPGVVAALLLRGSAPAATVAPLTATTTRRSRRAARAASA